SLRDAEQRYATLFDQVPAPVWLYDLDSLHLHAANHAAIRRYGWTRDEFLNMSLGDLAPPALRETLAAGSRPSASVMGPSLLTRHREKGGEEFDVLMNVSTVEIGGVRWGLAACVDLTLDRKNQERQQTSQRLESLGRLAGGIAHDFNNILTALQVDLALLVGDYKDHEPLQRELAHILAAVERASDLTRQILLFSRGEEAKRKPVHLNEAVRTIERLLMRSLGETVDLAVDLDPSNPMVSADPAQLQLALVNLCLNGRDAMPLGGILKVATQRRHIDKDTAERLGIRAGSTAVLIVTDNGSGMPDDILARAMEPFFTTKKAERGTGLGLSIVHGVARAHDGAVEIESTVGHGTRVTLYFPELLERGAPEGPAPSRDLRGAETVLLVDDEPAIRRAGSRMLERYGYRVILAEDGEDALRRLEAEPDIDLVITDMVMPRLDARGLIEAIRKRWPELPVLLSTGYDDNRLSPGISELFNGLVAKPYTPDEILGAVRGVLDGVKS
ncbi:MAG: ATP-binding protein, partial [Gemmatimonadales bacterium]